MACFDVHAHFAPAGLSPALVRSMMAEMKGDGFAGTGPTTRWSPEQAIAFMDERGIALQLLSMPMAVGVEHARALNESGARIVAEHPDRFGLLASLPMFDAQAAIDEIHHATGMLHADGFIIATNYSGAYFGDERLEPVWAELDRLSATVFVHPVRPRSFDELGLGRPAPLIEFPMETARTIIDAIYAGVFLRHSDMRLVLAHAGGVLPALAARILSLGTKSWVANPMGLTREHLRTQLSALYFDTAIAGTPASLDAVGATAGLSHLVFGTDYPPADIDVIDATIADLRNALDERSMKQLDSTFEHLFPEAAARATV